MFRMASFAATFFKDRDDYVAYTRFTKRSVLFEYVYSAEVSAHPKCCIIYSYHSRHIKKTKYIKISFSRLLLILVLLMGLVHVRAFLAN